MCPRTFVVFVGLAYKVDTTPRPPPEGDSHFDKWWNPLEAHDQIEPFWA